ncbi:Gfo/Idh/MocA family oxidoreductase [Sabulibacter ruber]|uniref:Gfo/Idh/MocA family oxidoreductase n=1 Tax=Sabulibacter ruber TaxID=2811901 RepID=UPI001A9616A9|nr:Gfo/Idh/MocA family oxidoreductase [Sabulibacter ruber]
MSTNRRDFLKLAGLAGVGLASTGFVSGCASSAAATSLDQIQAQAKKSHRQHFNMSGYAAPRMDKVRVGYIGLGMRGPASVVRMNHIDGVEINALCDIRPDRVAATLKKIEGSNHKPTTYSGKEDAWKELCNRNDIDLVYIATPWHLHTPMAVYAMEHGKHVAVEVPAAKTLEECWQLVETSERTKKHCMMLENCCYDFFEMLTLNMARQGFFGEIVHGEGAYIHNLIDLNFAKTSDTEEAYYNMWRLKENGRNGSLYPTHGLGPICQVMDINRGDQMDYLVSVSSNDFNMGARAKELASKDNFYQDFAQMNFRGNMNTTTIRTKKGRTIMIQHDVSSPRPYSRIHLVSGSKAMAQKWPDPARIATGHDWLSKEEFAKIEEQYTPPLTKKLGEMARKIGGHGGMDFLMEWRLVDCLRNGLPLDQDVYDAALWSAVAPLSEWSVANRSNSIDVPDFTVGAWQHNKPVELTLQGGGTTNVKA